MADTQMLCECTVTQGSATVISSGQSWLTEVAGGDYFLIDEDNAPVYVVDSVSDDNTLLLSTTYAGDTETINCVIHRDMTYNYGFPRFAPGDKRAAELLSAKIIDIVDESLYAVEQAVTALNWTGTESSTFQIDMDAAGPILKHNAGVFEVIDESGKFMPVRIHVPDYADGTLSGDTRVFGLVDEDGVPYYQRFYKVYTP